MRDEFRRICLSKVAFITASNMPKPDLETTGLVARLSALGCEAAQLTWDSEVDWSGYDLIVLRTPWDYVERLQEFLTWIRRVDKTTKLLNPAATIEWNVHKRYLLELQASGVPVVPTTMLTQADQPSIAALLAQFAGSDVVAKPAIGIGAIGALRCTADNPTMLDHIATLLANGDVLIQPFLEEVERAGEVSLIYVNGEYSHAVRKLPKPGDYRVQDHHGGTVEPYEPTKLERSTAEQALKVAPNRTLYARIDLVQNKGRPVVMELELIEPELFLRFSDAGMNEYIAAVSAAAITAPGSIE
jgi:glutathione synthase/RimK-type ligase-like ATP-grasp enzyme